MPTGLDEPRFWKGLAAVCAARVDMVLVPDGPKGKPMGTVEAGEFEKSEVQFGKYRGFNVEDVPAQYLDYLLDNEFQANLRRYVASDHFKAKQVANT